MCNRMTMLLFMMMMMMMMMMIGTQIVNGEGIINPPLGQPYGGNLVVSLCQTSPQQEQLWLTGLPNAASPIVSYSANQGPQWCWDVEIREGDARNGNMQLYQCSGQTRQNFSAVPGGVSAEFQIMDLTKERAVAVAGAAGTQVQMAVPDEQAVQQGWKFRTMGKNAQQIYVKIGAQEWCATAGGLADIRATGRGTDRW